MVEKGGLECRGRPSGLHVPLPLRAVSLRNEPKTTLVSTLGARPSWPLRIEFPAPDLLDNGHRLPVVSETVSPKHTEAVQSPRGWHSRGYLPHFDAGEAPQAITFRLAGSIPTELLRLWQEELKPVSVAGHKAMSEERLRIEHHLNQGIGPTWLADPRIATLVEGALQFFDGTRYRLHAWVIMPNHIHVVITPLADVSISRIVASWKSFTANRANTLLGRSGAFWQEDYFDQFIRDERHFTATIRCRR